MPLIGEQLQTTVSYPVVAAEAPAVTKGEQRAQKI